MNAYFIMLCIALSPIMLYPEARLISSVQDVKSVLKDDLLALLDAETLEGIDRFLASEKISEADRTELRSLIIDVFTAHISVKSFAEQAVKSDLYKDWLHAEMVKTPAKNPLLIFSGIFGIGFGAVGHLASAGHYLKRDFLLTSYLCLALNVAVNLYSSLLEDVPEESKVETFESALNLLAKRLLEQGTLSEPSAILNNNQDVSLPVVGT